MMRNGECRDIHRRLSISILQDKEGLRASEQSTNCRTQIASAGEGGAMLAAERKAKGGRENNKRGDQSAEFGPSFLPQRYSDWVKLRCHC